MTEDRVSRQLNPDLERFSFVVILALYAVIVKEMCIATMAESFSN